MNRLLEIRTYRLKPGTLHAFHQAMHQLAVPMIRAHGMDVVYYGPSDHEEESYCLVRAYADRESLETEQAAFYHSTEWREGPRQGLVVHIETYLNTLLWMTDDAVESLRTLNPS
ncbi:NIPSNAP family protein [Burkholderia sp. D-99]|uniref:NIPSNAP family protein n=1 Tax=Burkholderia sp. D-99 TaxID=2717316 RepID=UPI001420CF5E|nr:NIPSNAP family protein [Burkholderia sp. D-99]NHV26419.1 NIPSNAP family protein [Burkholderia sp. D-99]